MSKKVYLLDLEVGQEFMILGATEKLVYEYRGNGWFNTKYKQLGGPWHSEKNLTCITEENDNE